MSKTCRSCLTDKDISYFQIDKNGKDGHRNQCKSCRHIYRIEYYFKHREQVLKKHKERYLRNTEGHVKKRNVKKVSSSAH